MRAYRETLLGVHVYITPGQQKALRDRAVCHGVSFSALVREALDTWIKSQAEADASVS